ncbi:MAG: DinB family protein [Cyclobacteriaceae bacterium]|jgi:uncharacterized damage-inducible protein DinB|nr:DinB family protein [Cyclobacteriaceae bacterium]
MKTEVKRLVRQWQKTFDGHPWHGPALMEVLNSLSEQTAQQRIGSGHSINELVLHMTAWRTFVVARLQGDVDFEVSDTDNFPVPGSWEKTLRDFRQSQDALLRHVKDFPEEKLDTLVPTRKYTYYTMLHGIHEHDIYHLGQIVYIVKNAGQRA